jgi:hypothetical protein
MHTLLLPFPFPTDEYEYVLPPRLSLQAKLADCD